MKVWEGDCGPEMLKLSSFAAAIKSKLQTISEWDTLEQAQAGGDALGLAQNIADLGIKAETVYVYEVVTQA